MDLQQHQREIERNRRAWERKPLLRAIYAGSYERIAAHVDERISGHIVELGSGIGNLKARFPQALATDIFPNPWLDLVCDAYELPFKSDSVSHLILFDVFHHLERPAAFFNEARRVLAKEGRVILFEPFVSWASWPVYGLLHHEPIAWRDPIDLTQTPPSRPRRYYAAQGNATRLFFPEDAPDALREWKRVHAEAFATFAYVLSGGFSKPAMYPARSAGFVERVDRWLSRWPVLFGARCLIVLQLS